MKLSLWHTSCRYSEVILHSVALVLNTSRGAYNVRVTQVWTVGLILLLCGGCGLAGFRARRFPPRRAPRQRGGCPGLRREKIPATPQPRDYLKHLSRRHSHSLTVTTGGVPTESPPSPSLAGKRRYRLHPLSLAASCHVHRTGSGTLRPP
jgi:hypothetical protein